MPPISINGSAHWNNEYVDDSRDVNVKLGEYRYLDVMVVNGEFGELSLGPSP